MMSELIVEFWRGDHDERKINILSAGEIKHPDSVTRWICGKK